MKIILSVMLIIVMGISTQKEITMIREDGKKEVVKAPAKAPAPAPVKTPATVNKPPAWIGSTKDKGERDDPTPAPQVHTAAPLPAWAQSQVQADNYASGDRNGGAYQQPVNKTPAFVTNQFQNRLNAAMGLATTQTNIPGTNVPMGADPRPQMNPVTVPNWMYNNPNMTAGWMAGADNINPNMPNVPTGSFLAGNGEIAMGDNGQAVSIAPAGVNTFIGAGGAAVRGPYTPIRVGTYVSGDRNGGAYAATTKKPSGFGSSYGGNWSGGGGGGGYSGGGYDAPAWMSSDPAYMNLYSWNYKG